MSNVGYDLDTSGGLMPLIRALIKPPDEEANVSKQKKSQHPYYKRPGKGHNHDSCDACGEGGDLICCDRCPASFHLGCYDPPLDENDIPSGLWLCKQCMGSDATTDAEKPTSSRSSRAQSPADSKSDSEKRIRSLRKRSNSTTKKKRDGEEEVKAEEPQQPEEEKELTPMEVLVKAAKIMNPKQFELPREMRVPCLFPGTEKEGSKNGNASVISVDSSGCVPLPAKSCFVCSGTCKQAPLILCDYCPLLFHQDCLDPPMTALPTGRWMCPNHVEQYIDWKLVNSISATERVALWDKFSGPVDQHAIKIDFIRRARKAQPAFRVKVPVGVRGRVMVPDMVRYHYTNPPPLLPSRREHVRCQNVLKKLKATGLYSESSDTEADIKKHPICLNVSCPSYSGGECLHAPRDHAADDLAAMGVVAQAKTLKSDSSDLSDSDFEYLTAPVKRRKISESTNKRVKGERLEFRADGDAEELLAMVEEQLNKLDERLIKLLAWQRLQQIAAGEQTGGLWRRSALCARAESAIRRSVDRARLARHGLRRASLPSQLLSRPERERIAAHVWGAPPTAVTPPHSCGAHAHDAHLLRAALCPVTRSNTNGLGEGIGRPVPMRSSQLSIGTDSGCDVVLDCSACRRVSRTHAIIFFDEVSQQFECINYSEWGTQVNGVLYTCDVSDTSELAREERRDSLRELLANTRPHRVNGSITIGSNELCSCGSAVDTAGAWEGSAVVPHGALLQFGCLMYVFTIPDARGFPYEEKTDLEPAL